jgi:hypothetical protein
LQFVPIRKVWIPLSLVLTEQDYVNFIFNMMSLDRNPVMLPAVVRRFFATSSKLLIGYTLDDMKFGFLFTVETTYSVAVMPPTFEDANGKI